MHKQPSPLAESKNTRMKFFTYALLFILLITATSCGKGDKEHSTSTKNHENDSGQELSTFNIDLLDLSIKDQETIFAFPLMSVRIDEKKPYVIDMQVVVDCTKSEVAAELGENTNKYIGVFDLVFSIRSKSQVSNSADRMDIRDEIIKRLERELKTNGFEPAIREIYFTKYHIHRNYL